MVSTLLIVYVTINEDCSLVVRLVLRSSHLPAAVRSLLSRVLLAVYVSLPLMQPSLVSADLSLHGLVYEKVRNVCVEQASGTSNVLSKSLGLVVSSLPNSQTGTVRDLFNPSSSSHRPVHVVQNVDAVLRDIDILLHPRVPPLVRSLPHVELLSLFREEEGDEERGMRKTLRLANAEETLSMLSSSPQHPEAPPEPVNAPSIPSLGRTELVANSSTPGQFTTPIRQLPQMQISPPTANTPQPIASRPTALVHAAPTSSTTHITAASNHEERDTLHGQGPPLPSHSAPLDQATPTAAPYTSVIQPPIAGASTAPSTAPVPETRAPGSASIPMDQDQDDEDEPMPAINMDSDSDGDI